MKRLCCLLAVSMAFAQMVSAGDLQPDKETVAVNEKVYCSATLEDDFLDDSVIVVINKEVSNQKQQFTVADFELSTVSEVKNLTGDVTGYDTQNAQVLFKSLNADSVIEQEGHKDIVVLELETKGKQNVLDTIKQLEELDFVESAEPNYLFSPDDILADDSAVMYADSREEQSQFPNDIYRSYQYALDKISIEDVWRVTTGSSTVRVGVIDSGIASHSELNANVTTGWDFVNQNSATRDDPSGHGTHVAGIIGAIGNNFYGVCGLNWEVELVPLQVAEDDRYFSLQAIIQAVQYATVNNIPIINCSFGDEEDSNALEEAIAEYPGVVVCSAGNNRQNTDSTPHYPSGYNCDNIISVAATGESDDLWLFSNYGAATVDIGAPGVSIYSTVLNNVHDYKSGTSMAAPYVTGVAALIKSVRPEMSAIEIKNCILQGATPIEALSGKCVTGGLLNAKGAFVKAGIITQQTLTGDFNGDGKDDWALVQSYPQSQTVVQVRPSIGNVYATDSVWWDSGLGNFNLLAVQNNVCAGDFNGDGKDDIAMMYDYGNSQAAVYVLLSQGSSFSSQVWYAWSAGAFNANSVTGRFTAGDVNGDGKDDIVMMYDYGNSQATVYAMISQGSSFSNQIWYAWSAGGFNANSVAERFTADDLTGDGKDDVAMMYDYGNNRATVYALISQGSSFSNQVWYAWSAGAFNANSVTGRFTAGDFNGDGKDDVAMMYDYGNNQATVYALISQGSSFSNQVWYSWSAGTFNANAVTGRFTAGNFNVDGKDDILSNYLYSYGTIKSFVQYSTGSGFTDIQEWSRNYD